jgi:Lanthionine synthetase C-like protein
VTQAVLTLILGETAPLIGNMGQMLWRVEEHEPLTEREWDALVAAEAIGAIVADAEAAERDGGWPGHPLDHIREDEVLCALYLGGAGVIWALSELGSSLDCRTAIASTLERYRTSPDAEEQVHPPSLLDGETGVLVVADKLGSPVADLERLRGLIHANRECPTWELLYGSPGTILAARACGLEDQWRDSAELLHARWDESTDMWTGRFAGDVQDYLGPAHGFAGNVHALRGFVEEDILRERVARLLSRTAGREDGLVNWPPRDRPLSEEAATIRVQWCHGAPGIISTLGDLMPLELAIGGGELTWCAGPLRKGPGLCHGTAGNGFAFLRLHELTGDARWLDRGRRFAMHAIEQVERERANRGRGRYALFTGDVGVALYLRACLDADPAFPIIDTFSHRGVKAAAD